MRVHEFQIRGLASKQNMKEWEYYFEKIHHLIFDGTEYHARGILLLLKKHQKRIKELYNIIVPYYFRVILMAQIQTVVLDYIVIQYCCMQPGGYVIRGTTDWTDRTKDKAYYPPCGTLRIIPGRGKGGKRLVRYYNTMSRKRRLKRNGFPCWRYNDE